MKNHHAEVGIFWFYKQAIIAKSVSISELCSDSVGVFDSGFSHDVEWELNYIYLPEFRELIATEYQEIARGRVLYCQNSKLFKVYGDKQIIANARCRELIRQRFKLGCDQVSWLKDPHYKS
ncbi:hypothetical protein DS2_19111 [Catenovulum agarivorans DS-2]|uniref:Uncharacterized protein n=1 Tax=Catenovulum agarivorans DS-2 TaxID=1328313 RepID=W7QGQ4_9ALTE|nr:hypothetical protein [Catenovulum agarivorans]EWH08097.1 hypothetical protein DS2_19111 [Catenovulum agarivorans DS-2]